MKILWVPAALLILAASSIDPTLAQTRPAPPTDEQLARPNHPGWSVDERTGCWIWNQSPQPGETVTWSGACSGDGRGLGPGIVEWNVDGKVSRYEGDYLDGKEHG